MAAAFPVMSVIIGTKSFVVPARWVQCRACGARMLVKLRELRRGRGTSCSTECALASRKVDGSGERNSRVKLTWLEVVAIRAERAQGYPLSVIAADYGVTEANVWAICSGRTWKGGPPPTVARITIDPPLPYKARAPKKQKQPTGPKVCDACRAGDCLCCDGGCACELCKDLDRMVEPVSAGIRAPVRSVQASARKAVYA